jgi:DNA-binding transcriptional LysR family regulator
MDDHFEALTLQHLVDFVDVARHRSIQAASRATGRSRATYLRHLQQLQRALRAPPLIRRAAGQRTGALTEPGEQLLRRASVMLAHWERFVVETTDALSTLDATVRVGTLAGSFDLIADILADLRREAPQLPLSVIELPDDRLLAALTEGQVDLGFGTADAKAAVPRGLSFRTLGPLPWAVILPRAQARRFKAKMRLADLDGVPLVVLRSGPARERLEREFAQYAGRPLVLNAAFQVGSTPRVVDMVARGFGPAIVSRFRLAFLPKGVVVRPLTDGPAPLSAGVYLRRGARLGPAASHLLDRAATRFSDLASD